MRFIVAIGDTRSDPRECGNPLELMFLALDTLVDWQNGTPLHRAMDLLTGLSRARRDELDRRSLGKFRISEFRLRKLMAGEAVGTFVDPSCTERLRQIAEQVRSEGLVSSPPPKNVKYVELSVRTWVRSGEKECSGFTYCASRRWIPTDVAIAGEYMETHLAEWWQAAEEFHARLVEWS